MPAPDLTFNEIRELRRQFPNQEAQNILGPMDRRTFFREAVRENPFVAFGATLLPIEQGLKATGLLGGRSDPSLRAVVEGIKGVGEGLLANLGDIDRATVEALSEMGTAVLTKIDDLRSHPDQKKLEDMLALMPFGTGTIKMARGLLTTRLFTKPEIRTLLKAADEVDQLAPIHGQRAAILRANFKPAIKTGKKVVSGKPGVDTHDAIIAREGLTQTARDQVKEGFLTSKGKFLTRPETRKATGGLLGDSFSLFSPAKLQRFESEIMQSEFGFGRGF